jgi:hypothetical protein
MPPARLARVHAILERSPSIDEILSVKPSSERHRK